MKTKAESSSNFGEKTNLLRKKIILEKEAKRADAATQRSNAEFNWVFVKRFWRILTITFPLPVVNQPAPWLLLLIVVLCFCSLISIGFPTFSAIFISGLLSSNLKTIGSGAFGVMLIIFLLMAAGIINTYIQTLASISMRKKISVHLQMAYARNKNYYNLQFFKVIDNAGSNGFTLALP